MCDLLSFSADLAELSRHFDIERVQFEYKPRYSIAPTEQVPVIRHVGGQRSLQQYRWGLMPFWAKDAVLSDSESVLEKRAYRRMFAKQRCIIPCSGFYVCKTEGKVRQPVRIVHRDKGFFGIAGLFEIWKDPRENEYGTCTLMTTRSNRLVYEYSPMMPAILREEDMSSWLDAANNEDTDYLQTLLKPYYPERMHSYPVKAGLNAADQEAEEWDEALSAKYALLKR